MLAPGREHGSGSVPVLKFLELIYRRVFDPSQVPLRDVKDDCELLKMSIRKSIQNLRGGVFHAKLQALVQQEERALGNMLMTIE